MILIISLLITNDISVWAANTETQLQYSSATEILDSYWDKIYDENDNSNLTKSIDQHALLKQERNKKLSDAGYIYYEVSSDNYEIIEQELHTDLDTIGVNPNDNVLIILGDPEEAPVTRGTPGNSFIYNYNGTNYSMRYLTVTANDPEASSLFAQASTADLLKSASETIIANCLNTAIGAYLSYINSGLGTVASLCGLSISDFGTAKSSTLMLFGGSNWTRVFTQVYSPYSSAWVYGSCVEYVKFKEKIKGQYYSKKTNAMEFVTENPVSKTFFSSNYNNYTWRKQQGVIGYLGTAGCIYDLTGNVYYKYGTTTKITHSERF